MKPTWTHRDATNPRRLACDRCGDGYTLPATVPLCDEPAMVRAFLKLHGACEEKAADEMPTAPASDGESGPLESPRSWVEPALTAAEGQALVEEIAAVIPARGGNAKPHWRDVGPAVRDLILRYQRQPKNGHRRKAKT